MDINIMNKINFICGDWHCWNCQKGYLLSDESTKIIKQFETIDLAINFLFLSGNKKEARELNNEAKANHEKEAKN